MSQPSTPAKKKRKPAKPAQPYTIAQAPWGGGRWSIYIPSHSLWSSLEPTPERLVAIYGGAPTNLKELQKKGFLLQKGPAAAKPAKRKAKRKQKAVKPASHAAVPAMETPVPAAAA